MVVAARVEELVGDAVAVVPDDVWSEDDEPPVEDTSPLEDTSAWCAWWSKVKESCVVDEMWRQRQSRYEEAMRQFPELKQ